MFLRNKISLEMIFALGLFLAVSLFATWPLAGDLTRAIPAGETSPAKTLDQIFTVEWTAKAIECGLPYWDAPYFSPEKGVFAWGENQPLLCLAVWLLSKIFGYVLAYNLFVLLSFSVLGVLAYLFARLLFRDKISCFFSGLLTAFSPFMVQNLGNLYLVGFTLSAASMFCVFLSFYKERKVFLLLSLIFYLSTWFVSKETAFVLTAVLVVIVLPFLFSRKWFLNAIFYICMLSAVVFLVVSKYVLVQMTYFKIPGLSELSVKCGPFAENIRDLFLSGKDIFTVKGLKYVPVEYVVAVPVILVLTAFFAVIIDRQKGRFRKRFAFSLFFWFIC
ncbi:MAG: hypothetical protein PHW46_03950, partial [Candidatus Omnitrophica bacterium]|nr:hypothetical protein [Candidatus Omnitrophota bacterium]